MCEQSLMNEKSAGKRSCAGEYAYSQLYMCIYIYIYNYIGHIKPTMVYMGINIYMFIYIPTL